MQEGEAAGMSAAFRERLETEFDASKSYKPNKADWLEGAWSGLSAAKGEDRRGNTAASLDLLREAGAGITRVPEDFNLNRKNARQINPKRPLLETGQGLTRETTQNRKRLGEAKN